MDLSIDFKLLTQSDACRLHAWLQLPHIREFWDDGDRTLAQVLSHYYRQSKVRRYLFYINDEASGYIQSYVIEANHHYAIHLSLQLSTAGIDYFIGNLTHLNRGFSIKILNHFISTHLNDFDQVIVDPESHNTQAIHIYQQCGFKKIVVIEVKNRKYDLMVLALNKKNESKAHIT